VIHSPLQDKISPPKSLPDSAPYAPGLEMIVDIPAEDQGKCDIYLDNGVTIVPERVTTSNVHQLLSHLRYTSWAVHEQETNQFLEPNS
jgi:hypothetical protein